MHYSLFQIRTPESLGSTPASAAALALRTRLQDGTAAAMASQRKVCPLICSIFDVIRHLISRHCYRKAKLC